MTPSTLPLAPPNESSPTLADEFDALYRETRAMMGDEDLEHIRNVAAYSRALDARARELIMHGGSRDALWRGALLRGLHILLEFSELGHNILHGSYDHLEPGGSFHSERWDWDFVTDPTEWKVMHHRNHHPFTNIVGKDHDLGFSIARLFPEQNWYGHHAIQAGVLGMFVAHIYPFAIYTATSAARVEGRPVARWRTIDKARRRILDHVRREYLREPAHAGRRALHTIAGNYLGNVLGYDMLMSLLLVEHHAPNVDVFVDPGPTETRDAYYARQLRGTTNFTPIPGVRSYLERILREEIDFSTPPDFEVFYGGLDTHLEHHLFPDLPCNRQREVVPRVKAICERHGEPYNVLPLETLLPGFLGKLARQTAPLAETERLSALLSKPRAMLRRLHDGLRYHTPAPNEAPPPYIRRTRYFNAPARVLEVTPLAGGDAIGLRLARPLGWDAVTWTPGAFVSVRVQVGDEELVRQYSLTRESAECETLDFTIKRVPGGRVSNHLNDTLRANQWLTLVGPPESTGGLTEDGVPDKALYLAGGVGITPILAMLRQKARVAPESDAVLLYFNRSDESALYVKELAALARRGGVRFASFVDGPDGATGQARLSRELLAQHVPDLAEREVFACAPEGFLAAAAEHVTALGLPADRFHVERFAAPPKTQIPLTGRTHQVRFVRSQASIEVDEATTLLDAAREAGLDLPSGCERGLCKACVCSKRTGATTAGDHVHDAPDRITLCNTFPRSPVDLDA